MAGTLGIVTLAAWLLTAGIGGCMLAALVRDGIRQGRSGRSAWPPPVLTGHFCLALSGLAAWAWYVASGWTALAWTALGLMMPAIGLGVSTVTIWTPFPGSRPDRKPAPASLAGPDPAADPESEAGLPRSGLAGALADAASTERLIDDLVARLLAGSQRSSRRPRWPVRTLIPAGHGVAAALTFVLAVLTVAGTR